MIPKDKYVFPFNNGFNQLFSNFFYDCSKPLVFSVDSNIINNIYNELF